jgi:hypothetical protein
VVRVILKLGLNITQNRVKRYFMLKETVKYQTNVLTFGKRCQFMKDRKPGVYMNKFNDRGDLVIIHDFNLLPECSKALTFYNFDVLLGIDEDFNLLWTFYNLEYLGDL